MYGSYSNGPVKRAYSPFGELDIARLFPLTFSLISLVICLVPAIILISVVRHPAVAPFTARWCYLLLANPMIVIVVHIVFHVKTNGKPHFWGIVIAVMIPGLLLFVFAFVEERSAMKKVEQLMNPECSASTAKLALQEEWEIAYKSFEVCALQSGTAPPEHLIANFRFQDCQEYGSLLGNSSSSWKYLRYMEENLDCSGWCYPGVQLWSMGPARDSCSVAAANAFQHLVAARSKQVARFIILIMLLSAIGTAVAGPHMRFHGYTW